MRYSGPKKRIKWTQMQFFLFSVVVFYKATTGTWNHGSQGYTGLGSPEPLVTTFHPPIVT